MRMWRNGLAALAQEVMKVDPFSGALLIFVGKHYNAVKIVTVWPWPMDRCLARGG